MEEMKDNPEVNFHTKHDIHTTHDIHSTHDTTHNSRIRETITHNHNYWSRTVNLGMKLAAGAAVVWDLSQGLNKSIVGKAEQTLIEPFQHTTAPAPVTHHSRKKPGPTTEQLILKALENQGDMIRNGNNIDSAQNAKFDQLLEEAKKSSPVAPADTGAKKSVGFEPNPSGGM